MNNPDSIEIFKILKSLSSVFVNIEQALKENPNISLHDFCEQQDSHPLKLLYSKGFSGLLSMAALIPIKEALEKNGIVDFKNTDLQRARNALCHGTINFMGNGKIRFVDRKKVVELSPNEIIELAVQAYSHYKTSHSELKS